VRACQEAISSREYTEWVAYTEAFGPVGPVREDLRAALIACVIANGNRGKHARPYGIEDFLLYHERPALEPADLLQKVALINAQMGWPDLRPSPEDTL
jgi:hypothetical protein